MRLIVTGREGQVVRSLVERGAHAGVDVVCLGRPEFDLLEPASVTRAIEETEGDVVINAAAYTAVDKAESEPDLAMRINAEGARGVALGAARSGRPFVQISTDYVFDGTLGRPYREDDPVGPIGVYGRSKLAGEIAVASVHRSPVIVRTAWVYSPFGQNFLKTMLRLGESRDTINVVADQAGAPTNALDIADALIAVARRLVAEPANSALSGIFHLTSPTCTTWAGFAQAIFEAATRFGRTPVTVVPITSAQYPTPAKRPANSRLDVTKLLDVYQLVLPDWHASAEDCVARMLAAQVAEREQR